MFYELQKILAIESYKAIDLHEFAKLCRYTNQTLRNVNNKFRNIKEDFEDNDIEREKIIVIVNSNQINQKNDRANSRSRFEIFESESSSQTTTQSSENQINAINCYNCEKSKHFSRQCRSFRTQMNLNNLVRKMNVHERNDSSSQKNNSDSKSRKE